MDLLGDFRQERGNKRYSYREGPLETKRWHAPTMLLGRVPAPSRNCMKKSSTILLQTVIVLIGIGAFAFMLWEPLIEGRNLHATLFQVYFNDPFLGCAYIASIPFFVALYQAFVLLRYIGQNKIFSQAAVNTLRIIQYCTTAIISFVVAGEAYLFIVRPGDDIAGGVFMGLLIIFVFGTITITGAMFERILQNAVDLKSENDLAV
jgi:Protein of unknown function (DUF2975)